MNFINKVRLGLELRLNFDVIFRTKCVLTVFFASWPFVLSHNISKRHIKVQFIQSFPISNIFLAHPGIVIFIFKSTFFIFSAAVLVKYHLFI